MSFTRLRANVLQLISVAMVIALVVITIVSMSGAGESRKPMSEVAPQCVRIFANERAEESTDRVLKKYYGLNAADYESVVIYFPVSNMDAEELLIIKLKNTAQADSVKEAISRRQATQMGIYEGYAPEQLSLCENAVIDVQGNYILYAVHQDASKIDEAFRASLK